MLASLVEKLPSKWHITSRKETVRVTGQDFYTFYIGDLELTSIVDNEKSLSSRLAVIDELFSLLKKAKRQGTTPVIEYDGSSLLGEASLQGVTPEHVPTHISLIIDSLRTYEKNRSYARNNSIYRG